MNQSDDKYLLDLFRYFNMCLVARILNNIPLPIGQFDVVLRISHFNMVSLEISIDDENTTILIPDSRI
jgi:hypothetical protein